MKVLRTHNHVAAMLMKHCLTLQAEERPLSFIVGLLARWPLSKKANHQIHP
jgi:hypothetical protein